MSEDTKTETIYKSCEAANEALGPCRRPLANSDGGHWWYIDSEDECVFLGPEEGREDYIPCVCKSCPQKMRLSVDAEEYPL